MSKTLLTKRIDNRIHHIVWYSEKAVVYAQIKNMGWENVFRPYIRKVKLNRIW
jgi:hypothetical protein